MTQEETPTEPIKANEDSQQDETQIEAEAEATAQNDAQAVDEIVLIKDVEQSDELPPIEISDKDSEYQFEKAFDGVQRCEKCYGVAKIVAISGDELLLNLDGVNAVIPADKEAKEACEKQLDINGRTEQGRDKEKYLQVPFDYEFAKKE